MKPFNAFGTTATSDFMRLRWVSLAVAAPSCSSPSAAWRSPTASTPRLTSPVVVGGPALPKAVGRRRHPRPAGSAGFAHAQVQTFGTGNDVWCACTTRMGVAADATTARSPTTCAGSCPRRTTGRRLSSGLISAQIGEELAYRGAARCSSWSLGFLIYIWFRFERKFAIAAIITTLHDVIIVAGWFALTGHEFDLTVLAGVLSVMGYPITTPSWSSTVSARTSASCARSRREC